MVVTTTQEKEDCQRRRIDELFSFLTIALVPLGLYVSENLKSSF